MAKVQVRTTDGALVLDSPVGAPKDVGFTPEQAKAHAADCNKRAEALGIKTRYTVTEE
jgi:hypothetical protein